MRLHCWRPHNFPHVITLCHADPHGVVDRRSRDIPGLRYKYMRDPQLFEAHYRPLAGQFRCPLRTVDKRAVRLEAHRQEGSIHRSCNHGKTRFSFGMAGHQDLPSSLPSHGRSVLRWNGTCDVNEKECAPADRLVAVWMGYRPHWWCPDNGRFSRVIRPRLWKR